MSEAPTSTRRIAIVGLPASGKTTFLAALWNVLTARDLNTALRFRNLASGNVGHLHAIADRWRDAREQDRTSLGGHRLVQMNLADQEGLPLAVNFPDVPGEIYRRMWEDRDCEPEIAEILTGSDVLLFIHSDTIQHPRWTIDEAAISKRLGIQIAQGQVVEWHPCLAPTQVQVVGLLQVLASPPFDTGPRRLAIVFSAWDKGAQEGLPPDSFLDAKLPLLAQYLCCGSDSWAWRTYGLSAQGGEYDPPDPALESSPQALLLRNLDEPSRRIRLVDGESEHHDVTEPLAWLMK